MNTQSLTHNPRLPGLLRLPISLTPARLHNRLLVTTLNRLFKEELQDDEMDFLQDKIVAIHVIDAGLNIRFTMQQQTIKTCHTPSAPDLTIEGSAYDFLLLASRREDPDTLFFNRRLKLNGDTELGLYVKNFLDALDLTERWKYLYKMSDKASRIAERFG